MSQRQKKQVRIERKFMRESASLLEKLVAVNATKTELRQYTLVIIIAADATLSSAEKVYFDGIVS